MQGRHNNKQPRREGEEHLSIHTCSYYCERPECIKAQRDELRQKLEQAEKQEPVGYFSVNDYGNWEQNESNHGTPLYAAPPNTGAAVKAERKACVKVCDEQAEYWKNTSILEFAYQVAAEEREACAEICDGISEWYETRTDLNQTQKQVGQLAAEVCGVRIRERSER